MAAALVLPLNWLTIGLSPIALFLAAIYPFCKRWIHMPQAVLGIAFGWVRSWHGLPRGPPSMYKPGGFSAQPSVGQSPTTRSAALQDREDDQRIGGNRPRFSSALRSRWPSDSSSRE